jgi:putative transcriptional regulator
MDDPNFRQTVMLMVQHDEDGALALVLNRPSNITLKQAWAQVGSDPCRCEGMLGIGGPCQGPIMALHSRKDVGEKQVLPGVFLSVEEENVSWLMRRGAEQLRCFIGYAGWAPGQLEEEIAAGSWKLIPAQTSLVFEPLEDLWKQVNQTAERAISYPNLLPHMIPHDPTMN